MTLSTERLVKTKNSLKLGDVPRKKRHRYCHPVAEFSQNLMPPNPHQENNKETRALSILGGSIQTDLSKHYPKIRWFIMLSSNMAGRSFPHDHLHWSPISIPSASPIILGTIPIPCCYPLTKIPVLSRECPHSPWLAQRHPSSKDLEPLGFQPSANPWTPGV
jgi:hypothetical protein